MSERARLGINALLFQLAWFCCVFGAKQPWLLLGAGACIALHFFALSRSRAEWRGLLAVAACGWVLDSALLQLGVFRMADAQWIVPLWLALLWLAFACSIGYSLQWTARPWWLGSLLGALAGPLSYWAGAKLAGVELPLGQWPSLVLLGGLWALLLPLLHLVWRSSHKWV